MNDKEDLHGYSAEEHIRHIFSDRMSSRPMGWKVKNVDNMSRLRLLREDGIKEKQGNVIEFEENKNKNALFNKALGVIKIILINFPKKLDTIEYK